MYCIRVCILYTLIESLLHYVLHRWWGSWRVHSCVRPSRNKGSHNTAATTTTTAAAASGHVLPSGPLESPVIILTAACLQAHTTKRTSLWLVLVSVTVVVVDTLVAGWLLQRKMSRCSCCRRMIKVGPAVVFWVQSSENLVHTPMLCTSSK